VTGDQRVAGVRQWRTRRLRPGYRQIDRLRRRPAPPGSPARHRECRGSL